MYKIFLILVLVILSAPCRAEDSGCDRSSPPLYQVSTIDALLAGAYDGEVTIAELARHGDFGIGTFDALDGEMLALDGVYYQIKADGVAYRALPDAKTPFASVVRFVDCATMEAPHDIALADLERWLDRKLVNLNLFYAVRVDGDFAGMKTRAVPRQKKPYPPLVDVVKEQPVFDLGEVGGVLVGLRSPAFSRGISVPGYHWHFLSESRKAGGHVLGFTLRHGSVSIDPISGFDVRLPRGGAFGTLDLARDRTQDLGAVEK